MPDADREMTLAEYVRKLHKAHRARKEYGDMVSFISDGTDDRVAANISAIRDIHDRSLRLIARVCRESLNAHPEHPDSYPEVLKTLADVTPELEQQTTDAEGV